MRGFRRAFSLAEMVLAFGIVAVAILSLMAVFLSGVQLAGRSRDLAAATELARQVMEQAKFHARSSGFAYVPTGSYAFDGRTPDATVGTAPLEFPPLPYPSLPVNNQKFDIVVTGSEISPTLKEIRVAVFWDASSSVFLETRLHP